MRLKVYYEWSVAVCFTGTPQKKLLHEAPFLQEFFTRTALQVLPAYFHPCINSLFMNLYLLKRAIIFKNKLTLMHEARRQTWLMVSVLLGHTLGLYMFRKILLTM